MTWWFFVTVHTTLDYCVEAHCLLFALHCRWTRAEFEMIGVKRALACPAIQKVPIQTFTLFIYLQVLRQSFAISPA
jgi:hypothetical protein